MLSLPTSSSNFDRLDSRLQRWIWSRGWGSLRPIQELAIPILIQGGNDAILAANTAGGKTEAAFFPILTNLLALGEVNGFILYVSPLKALINDQFDRLTDICEVLDVPVYAWHGDIASEKKRKFFTTLKGILLITPESLEALFVLHGPLMSRAMKNLKYVVIDELHAFIGSERGKQLQSLMVRLEDIVEGAVTRIGLSATIGDMALAANFLRPGHGNSVTIVQSPATGFELKVLIKGYLRKDGEPDGVVLSKIASDVFRATYGSNNLIFPKSRRAVELYTALLGDECERSGVANEYWAHHGSLASDGRKMAEGALKKQDSAANIVCTTTLELGIDVGSVKSICQIGAPPSVSSLRQRIGRSGRRKDDVAILKGYCSEESLQNNVLDDLDYLRWDLMELIAMVQLLLAGWCEAPRPDCIHGSTLIQQIMSIIAQKGGVTAGQLWSYLIADSRPFSGISKEDFFSLLKNLGRLEILMQDSSGLLLLGVRGEKIVNHFDFYCAFVTKDEYRLIAQGKLLGSISMQYPLLANSTLIFSGKRWRVIEVVEDKGIIYVSPDKSGAPPPFESEEGFMADTIVVQKIKMILEGGDEIPFLDPDAASMLEDARKFYKDNNLSNCQIFEKGSQVLVYTWCGGFINYALKTIIEGYGYTVSTKGPIVYIRSISREKVLEVLRKISILDDFDFIFPENIPDFQKWDFLLPRTLAKKSFTSLYFDLVGAKECARKLVEQSFV